MTTSNLPEPLAEFLRHYLSVDSNLSSAVETFVQTEPENVQALMNSIRRVFELDESPAQLKELLERTGNVRLSRSSPRDFLVDLFSLLARQARLPADVKPYDAFISYSSVDQQLAAWLAAGLRSRGYTVWLDRDEILLGHSILDEVYRGIRQSRFLIVLLTPASVKSRWVKEELSVARLDEIENAHVIVLPVKCEGNVEIPAVLRGKRVADFTSSREDGLNSLMRVIDMARAGFQEGPRPLRPLGTQDALRRWYSVVVKEPEHVGFDPTKGGYKDTILGPLDGEEITIDIRELQGLMERARVRINGWGGAPFPYKEYPRTRVEHVADGLRLIDDKPWPMSAWSFTYWRVTNTLQFFQRSNLLEDGEVNERGEAIFRGKLSVLWTIQDVCTSLMYAMNLLREVPSLNRLVVIHRLVGMTNRQLVFRGPVRLPIAESYIARIPDIEQTVVVERGGDLEAESLRVLANIFWLFHWANFRPEMVRGDVQSFLAGRFPA